MANTYIAAVRNKNDGEVHYVKSNSGQFKSWTSDIDEALHFEKKSNAERAIVTTATWLYEKKVGTKSQVSFWAGQSNADRGFVAAVRNRNTGVVRFRVAERYPHAGPGPLWSDKIADAFRFDTASAADRVLRLMSDVVFDKKDVVFDKKVGTPGQVTEWAAQATRRESSMRKLQDEVNANIKKIADMTAAPALLINEEANTVTFKVAAGATPHRDYNFLKPTAPAGDPILALVETYIEKAEKIEDEGADEFTWRGFLHAFLKDVTEVVR